MDSYNLSLIISVTAIIISVVSWFVLHSLSKKRDFINKKKEIRINYLIEAWRILEDSSNRNDCTKLNNTERAIADIQLFGTKAQINLAQKFTKEMSETNSAECLDLLIELRKELRKELRLEPVDDKFLFLRIHHN